MKEKDQVLALAVLMLAVGFYLVLKPPASRVVADVVDAGTSDASEPPPPEWVHTPAPTLSVPTPEPSHATIDAGIEHAPRAHPLDASAADASF